MRDSKQKKGKHFHISNQISEEIGMSELHMHSEDDVLGADQEAHLACKLFGSSYVAAAYHSVLRRLRLIIAHQLHGQVLVFNFHNYFLVWLGHVCQRSGRIFQMLMLIV